MTKFNAFTKKHPGLARQLLTSCSICEGYATVPKTGAPTLMQFRALWDTGATGTVISPKVVADLGLKSVQKSNMTHADGTVEVDVYVINIRLPNGVGFSMVPVLCSNITGTDVLIGMDIISQGDFALTNVGKKTVFSFRVPSVETIDYVQEWNDANAPAPAKPPKDPDPYAGTPLNADCPCGSGKKYKRCHGAAK